jgi:hypothetical protein
MQKLDGISMIKAAFTNEVLEYEPADNLKVMNPHGSSIETFSQSPSLSKAFDQDLGVPAPEPLVEPHSFLSARPNFLNECFIPFASRTRLGT